MKKITGGRCYINSYRYFREHGENNPNLRLVHGAVDGRGPISDLRIGHAWIEDLERNVVIEVSGRKPREIDKILYYAIGNIVETELVRFDFRQFIDTGLKFKHYGPWSDCGLGAKNYKLRFEDENVEG